jgi:hypothetical protein
VGEQRLDLLKTSPTNCQIGFWTELNRSNRSYSTNYKIILTSTGGIRRASEERKRSEPPPALNRNQIYPTKYKNLPYLSYPGTSIFR